eukprot:2255427-Rhodomonas_salina.1
MLATMWPFYSRILFGTLLCRVRADGCTLLRAGVSRAELEAQLPVFQEEVARLFAGKRSEDIVIRQIRDGANRRSDNGEA